jgi:hypothetical protein
MAEIRHKRIRVRVTDEDDPYYNKLLLSAIGGGTAVYYGGQLVGRKAGVKQVEKQMNALREMSRGQQARYIQNELNSHTAVGGLLGSVLGATIGGAANRMSEAKKKKYIIM